MSKRGKTDQRPAGGGGGGDAFDPNKPLFATRSNPNDYSNWLKEYDQLEGDFLNKHAEGHTVSNLKSLRKFCQSRSGGAAHATTAAPRTPPAQRIDAAARRIPQRPATSTGMYAAATEPRRSPPARARTPAPAPTTPPSRWGVDGAAAAAGAAGSAMRRPKSSTGFSATHRSATATPSSPRAPGADTPLNYNTMAACLRVVHPPPPSSGDARRFDVDTRGIDISWLRSGVMPSAAGLTLHSVPDTLLNDKGELPNRAFVTSPRSAFVLVSNGVSIYDLQAQPLSAFMTPGCTGEEQARHLQQLHHDRRRVAREQLLEQYEAVAVHTSIDSIINMIRGGRDTFDINKLKNEDEAYLARKEQAKRFLAACRVRLEREQDMAQTRRQDEFRAEQERLKRVKALEEEKERKMKAMRQKALDSEAAKEARREMLRQKKEQELEQTLERAKRMEDRDKVQREKRRAKEEEHRVRRAEAEAKHQEMFQRGKERFDAIRDEMRTKYTEKERLADIKRRAREEQERKERLAARDQAVVVARKREEALHSAREQMQHKVDQSLQKRRDAEMRFTQRQAQQQKERQMKLDRDRELEQERLRKKEMAATIELGRAHDIISKQRDRDAQFADRRTQKEKEMIAMHDAQRIELEDKRFRVRCQARATEFQKAVTLNSISTKMLRADAKSKVKDELVKESTLAREDLRRQKEQIMADCQRQAAKEKLAYTS